MASIFWKLVVAPLSAQSETRETIVVAENWLSALRLARKQLGEDGGVPPGASCVMAATGEVTIVDMTTRRRFVLARTNEPETKPKSPENAALIQTLPQPIEPASAKTQTTGPAPVGSAIAPTLSAPAPSRTASEAWPAPPPPVAPPSPAQQKARSSTMAYSPEESAAIRAELVAATQPNAQVPAAAQPPQAPVAPQPPLPSANPWVPLTKAGPVPAAAPAPAAPPEAVPAKRSTTVAYSPEESAAARAQLVAAQQPAGSSEQSKVIPSKVVAPAPVPVAQAPRNATVAYVQNPFAAGSGTLVALSSRDEEPSASSPLVYRERCYFSPNSSDAAVVEKALRGELATLRSHLDPNRRGVFVSLALFDHYYQGKPQRGPVATLQWKDWRGEPVFTFNTARAAAQLPSTPGEPVRTSFMPEAAAPAVPPAVVVGTPMRPAAPAAPPQPARREVVVGARAPSAAMATPTHSARDSWPPMSSALESTGDQDRRLAIAFEAVQDLYFLGSAADGMDFGVKLLSELVPCQAVTGCIYDINTDELRFLALTGPGADERRAGSIPASVGLIGAGTHIGKESLVINDVSSDPRYDPAADGRIGLEAQTMLILPLHHAENLLGALQLINRNHRKGFSEADVAVSTYVSGQLSEFLQAKRLSARRPR